MNFNYYSPTKVVFGRDTVKELPALLKWQGAKKVLVHYGSSSAEKSGLLSAVEALLEDSGIEYVKLGGVKQNPRIALVYEGIELARKENVDFILAIGGGSVIDSCKAIAYGLSYPGDVWELYEHTGKATGSFPVGVILTIPAAGSELSDSSVITDEKTLKKRGYNSDFCRPKFAIMDPSFTLTLSKRQTMCGVTDIMMHTMERYFGTGEHLDVTDSIAEGILRTVIKNARVLNEDPDNMKARSEIMWCGSLSHNNLTELGTIKDFATHMLEHELSGMFDVIHAEGLSVIWPAWARYVIDGTADRFSRFAVNVFGVSPEGKSEMETGLEGIRKFEEFMTEIGMPLTLSELGITLTEDSKKELAERCAKSTGGKKGSAKILFEKDMFNIYDSLK